MWPFPVSELKKPHLCATDRASAMSFQADDEPDSSLPLRQGGNTYSGATWAEDIPEFYTEVLVVAIQEWMLGGGMPISLCLGPPKHCPPIHTGSWEGLFRSFHLYPILKRSFNPSHFTVSTPIIHTELNHLLYSLVLDYPRRPFPCFLLFLSILLKVYSIVWAHIQHLS